ncbi:hypothetical protein QAD02_012256 [Eretmocerus hayati]|uniref:Uncharacterized protein n=1 Tax=Eretmocerus hayati TaxID=131215 RepID=A0ACC2NZE8_9HYME|nr:hypothetical protein QAD02_012256 [Eretmocerus hayati]
MWTSIVRALKQAPPQSGCPIYGPHRGIKPRHSGPKPSPLAVPPCTGALLRERGSGARNSLLTHRPRKRKPRGRVGSTPPTTNTTSASSSRTVGLPTHGVSRTIAPSSAGAHLQPQSTHDIDVLNAFVSSSEPAVLAINSRATGYAAAPTFADLDESASLAGSATPAKEL